MKITRLEVYGLFALSLIIGGGGVAFAATSTTTDTAMVVDQTATATPTPTTATTAIPDPVTTTATTTQTTTVVEEPHKTDTRVRGPWIGPSSTLAVDSQNYLCAWSIDGFGGRGYGFGPEAICNAEYLGYISSHCGEQDPVTGAWSGAVYRQLCDEWKSSTLRIQY